VKALSPVVPIVVVAVALQSAGCGGAPQSEGTPTGGPTAKQSLEDLARLLDHLKNENKKMPAKLAQIEPIEPAFPGAYLGLVQGNIVYLWGAPLNPSAGHKVLAYEKDAAAEGGWVLMQDGTVKTMAPDEFRSAPKAK